MGLTLVLSLVVTNLDSNRPLQEVLTVADGLIVGWLMLAVAVRRLHDRDKSGMWAVLFFIVPAVLLLTFWVAQWEPSNPMVPLTMSVVIVLSIWGFVEIGFLAGTKGDNQYGPDPLGSTSSKRLGISGSRITQDKTAAANVSDPHGVYVSQVGPRSLAATAGLEQGDIIQSFNGLRISSYNDLNDFAGRVAPGTTVQLTIVRNQEILTLPVLF
jgi:uncharacterized membrane protein YhaH (DUF805 family)